MTNSIEVEAQDGVVTIWINRPEAMNAITSEMRKAMIAAFEAHAAKAKVIFLRGRGGVFCSGQDLKEFMAGGLSAIDGKVVLEEEYEPILAAIDAARAPVIAAVEGAAVGAGLSLALACDYILAEENAYFQLAFSNIGLVPDVGASYHLPRIIGRARALAMALTAEKIETKRAQDWGMVWQSARGAEFEALIAAHAARYQNGAGAAMALTRDMMRKSQDQSERTQLLLEAVHQDSSIKSADFEEAVRAFLEKRPPQFRGA